mgnify:CR=1 FL=1
MDRNGYIGRAPADSSVIVARQVFSPSGVTTDFTFTSGYTPGYLDLYLNGSRLVEGTDYTATDTSTISVLNGGADGGDVVEAVAYKAFNVATATVGISSAGTSIGSVNALNFIGTGNTFALRGSTIDISISGSGGGSGVASTITVADESSDTTCFPVFVTAATGDLNPKSGSNLTFNSSSGALTASSFVGALTGDVTGTATTATLANTATVATNAQGLTGTPNISVGTISASGSVSIAGTLTYEDVTNIDSVGIITARSDISIADKIIHTGDTNTAIRFPAADTFTVETGGSEVARFDSSQRLLIGANSSTSVASESTRLQVVGATNDSSRVSIINNGNNSGGGGIQIAKARGAGGTIVQNNDEVGHVIFAAGDGTDFASISSQISCEIDGTPGGNDVPGRLTFHTTADGAASPTERLRIDSNGNLGIGENSPATKVHIKGTTPTLRIANGTSQVAEIKADTSATMFRTTTNHPLLFGTNDTERLRIGSSGQIGIAGANYGSSGQVLTSKGSGSAVAWESVSVGLTTEAATVTNGQTTLLDLGSAQDHKLTCTGTVTISCTGGTEAESHTVRIINSGITTVGFSTYFLFPSGSTPVLPTASGAISLISFTVNRVGAGGTQLLAGASLNFS